MTWGKGQIRWGLYTKQAASLPQIDGHTAATHRESIDVARHAGLAAGDKVLLALQQILGNRASILRTALNELPFQCKGYACV